MAAKKTYTIGLSKIEVGAIAEDGGMGETLDVLGYTYQDTCTMTQEDPETTDHYAEEVDDPVISISRGGKNELQLFDYEPFGYGSCRPFGRRRYPRHGFNAG